MHWGGMGECTYLDLAFARRPSWGVGPTLAKPLYILKLKVCYDYMCSASGDHNILYDPQAYSEVFAAQGKGSLTLNLTEAVENIIHKGHQVSGCWHGNEFVSI